MEKAAKLEALIAKWVTPPERTADITKKHDEHIRDLIELCVYLKSENDRKDKTIKDLESKVNGLLERENRHATTMNKTAPSFSQIVTGSKRITTEEAFLLTGVARETKKLSEIANNLVISNLPESNETDAEKRIEHDQKLVEDVVESMDYNHKLVTKVRRIKSFQANGLENANTRPGIVIATLSDTSVCTDIVRRASYLKQYELFKDVYVREDRTFAQRIVDKKLREECKAKNDAFELTVTVNGVQRKCGVLNGKHFYYVVRDSTVRRFFVKE